MQRRKKKGERKFSRNSEEKQGEKEERDTVFSGVQL